MRAALLQQELNAVLGNGRAYEQVKVSLKQHDLRRLKFDILVLPL